MSTSSGPCSWIEPPSACSSPTIASRSDERLIVLNEREEAQRPKGRALLAVAVIAAASAVLLTLVLIAMIALILRVVDIRKEL
mgnify:CR=1 FL=1